MSAPLISADVSAADVSAYQRLSSLISAESADGRAADGIDFSAYRRLYALIISAASAPVGAFTGEKSPSAVPIADQRL